MVDRGLGQATTQRNCTGEVCCRGNTFPFDFGRDRENETGGER